MLKERTEEKRYKLKSLLVEEGLEEIKYQTQSIIMLPDNCTMNFIVIKENNKELRLIDNSGSHYRYNLNKPLIVINEEWYTQDIETVTEIRALMKLIKR